MKEKKSAGILLFRIRKKALEVLLVHPGGPFWKNKDLGAWSIPKGEFLQDEDALFAAKREFKEELGSDPDGEFRELTPVKQKNGKTVYAWALEGDLDPSGIISNEFEVEWPPRSGRRQSFPEVDRAEWFAVKEALARIIEGQRGLILELTEMLDPTRK